MRDDWGAWLALPAGALFLLLVAILGQHAPATGIDQTVHNAVGGDAMLATAGSNLSHWLPRLAQLGLAGALVLLLLASQWWRAAALVGGEIATQGAVGAVKAVLARARPMGANVSGYAFPSGHATNGAAEWGLLLLIAVPAIRGDLRPTRGLIAAWCVLALLAGLARVTEGVHWLTDVMGGWLLGASIVGAAAWLVRDRPQVRAAQT